MTTGGQDAAARSAYTRKKQPERIRQGLLDQAMRLAADQGLAAVTTQAVAEAAGVTKGGLYHHFPSKQALVEGLFTHLLERLGAEIDARMAADPVAHGRFTRAYVAATLAEETQDKPWSAFSAVFVAEPAMSRIWADWLAERLARHAETDGGAELALVRLAADGAWLARVGRSSQGLEAGEALALLLPMTRPRG